MVTYMDGMIGRLDGKLQELGIRDRTLFIFLGDNGTHKSITTRFRGQDYVGGKGTTTARGTHVPCIVSWPSVIKKPVVNSDLISSVDFYPTLCEAAGVPIPAGLDGVNFAPQLRGDKGMPREWIYVWYSPRQRLDLSTRECAFDHDYKLYRNGTLFHLRDDPFEDRPLKASEQTGPTAKAVAKLRGALDQFRDARPSKLDEEFRASFPK